MENSEQRDWSGEFNALLTSPLGKELIAELEKLAKSTVESAMSAKSSDTAFGLLKESSGVIKAIGHLQFLGILPKGILPRSEGSQDK